MAAPQASPASEFKIRPLLEADLREAERIVRVAFGTFLGLPEPESFMGDASFAYSRWQADPSAAFAAEHEGKLIGSNFVTNWGSFGFFGPLTIDPAYWNRGVAQLLLAPTMELFRRWGCRHLGLYTFAHSPKHIGLYQKFGFWPRDLVATVAKGIGEEPPGAVPGALRFCAAAPSDHDAILAGCREVASANFEGLDVTREIRAVADQDLGDVILIWDDSQLEAFGVCHTGAGSEAGSGVCYVKFAAVRPGIRAAQAFTRLMHACESFGRDRSAKKLLTGVNVARREAFNHLRAMGYRNEFQGVAMETGSASSGYNRAGAYILDDWR